MIQLVVVGLGNEQRTGRPIGVTRLLLLLQLGDNII
jgi:hypothetical protein